ncbi:LAME_0H11826g1_1 [Lachancea meyersii CBS 8951]|uniref:Histone-lysine N-methyltransferase, H3 lysine-79 specific n=1 Tax=Lachancea meyersii CBS 8951 TaxID=1266667 RepID=A0A1G4KGI7_9SACH|nr:LAME_0H11826g1_1 [Lachancea meyersii CBS 8951]
MVQESSYASESLMSEVSRASSAETQVKSDDDEPRMQRKPRMNKSLLSLLNDACKYSAYNEFSMPSGFLRKKSRSSASQDQILENGQSAADVNSETIKRKDQASPPSEKQDAPKLNGKLSIEGPRSRRDRRISKKPTRFDEDAQESSSKSTSPTATLVPNLPKGAIRKSRSPSVQRPKNIARKTNISRPVGRPKKAIQNSDSFVGNWSSHYIALPDIFDLQECLETSAFTEELAHSSQLTRQRGGRERTIKLRYILYPDFEEEFVIDFQSDLSRYNPMSEIGRIIEFTELVYMPPNYRSDMKKRIIVPLNAAFDRELDNDFIGVIGKYNDFIKNIPHQEIIQHLKSLDKIPTALLHSILHMIYVRTIHPNAGSLKKYQAFSNYVYGELLPQFLTNVYKQCNLQPEHIFMDLGSGVGNCVFQAAAEFRCKLSFGCELMPHASILTEAQKKEFKNRCKLYGLKVGPTQFSLRQSFIDNPAVQELLPQCDVLLINNFIFDAQLNEMVRKLIQPLKVGCKIITLKNLRPLGYTIDYDHTDNILNRLKVERFDLKEDSVSWTHRGGEYYISTVQEDIDESIFLMHSKGRTRTKPPVKYTR